MKALELVNVLVILFSLLCLKVIKLEQVESLGTALTGIIGFLFVPSGISVINSLGVMGQYFVQILTVIVVATVILLAVTGLFAQFILGKDEKETEDTKELKVVNTMVTQPFRACVLYLYIVGR